MLTFKTRPTIDLDFECPKCGRKDSSQASEDVLDSGTITVTCDGCGEKATYPIPFLREVWHVDPIAEDKG